MAAAISLLLFVALPLLGLALLSRALRGLVLPGVGLRDLWTLEGSIDRAPYMFIGFGLFALKYNLERLVAGWLFGKQWSVLAHYLSAPQLQALGRDEGRFYQMMLLLSLPFVWTGVALTTRRLRSAGLPVGLVALFFVPIVNLFFFLMLAALPALDDAPGPSRFVDRLIPRSRAGSAALVVLAGAALTLAFAQFATAPAMRAYGWGLFVGLPFVLGLASALVHGHHEPRSLGECMAVAATTLGGACLLLLAAAVEGLLCVAMAAPLGLGLAAMGAGLGYLVQRRPRAPGHAPALLVLLALPALMGAETAVAPEPARPVATAVEVDAPPAAVWRNVVSFSELPAPAHWIFRLGFAYPVRATIAGRGPGAIRRCEFTTGAFVEPITVWDEPRRLAFSVASQPPPMRETSWYPDMRPAHLDGFLVSERGEFLLEPLPGGRTRLTGTTWYRHEIRPEWYWRPWSDFIIRRIHARVLAHVKGLSEKA